MSDDAVLLEMIKEAVRTGRYFFTEHALTKHTVDEGFTAEDALVAIENGEIVEHRRSESICLIAGSVPGLDTSPEYITIYIHCVCRYDRLSQIVIITMYRPEASKWINHFRRR